MPALDTNILVRYVTHDDEVQYQLAKKFILQSEFAVQERIFVPVTVILEAEWVLRSRYKFTKQQICDVLSGLVDTKQLEIDRFEAVIMAVLLYQMNKADFADCLHTAIASEQDKTPFYTFDINASEVSGNQLLE